MVLNLYRGKVNINSKQYVYGEVRIIGSSVYIYPKVGKRKLIVSDTLSQYTGLEDINGDKIFHEDTILIHGDNFKVSFHKGSFGYFCNTPRGELFTPLVYISSLELVKDE